MGHSDPSQELKKPWVKTPLIESAGLSKEAGWYCPYTELWTSEIFSGYSYLLQ